MSGRTVAKKYRFLIDLFGNLILIFPRSFRCFIFVRSRNLKGKFGIFVRYILLKHLVKQCGENVCIMENVFLHNLENLSIGSNVSIHPLCYIDAKGGLYIGDNVSIAHNCSLVSFNHTYSDPNLPIKYNPLIDGEIRIEQDVWIGCGVRILAGVTINERSIVAAGAVVNKNIPSNVIAAGVPAVPIKSI